MNYYLLFIPILVVLLTQVIKFFIDTAKSGFAWENFYQYGGMPSSHTAFVFSLLTVVFLSEGANSASFAIACVFVLVVIRDAFSLRNIIGKHSKILNAYLKKLPKKDQEQFDFTPERVGHTAPQIFLGALTGVFLTYLLYFVWLTYFI